MHWLFSKTSVWLYVVCLTTWGAALLGVLHLHRVSADWGHGFCGPWGCTAPTQALASYHGFWFILLVPPALVFGKWGPIQQVRRWGVVALLAGLIGLLGLLGYQLLVWYPNASQYARPYLLQRLLFSVADLVDVPLVPLTIAGATCLAAVKMRANGAGSIERNQNPDGATVAQQQREEHADREQATSVSER